MHVYNTCSLASIATTYSLLPSTTSIPCTTYYSLHTQSGTINPLYDQLPRHNVKQAIHQPLRDQRLFQTEIIESSSTIKAIPTTAYPILNRIEVAIFHYGWAKATIKRIKSNRNIQNLEISPEVKDLCGKERSIYCKFLL